MPLKYLKGLLWFIAVYQFVVGASLLVSPAFARFVVQGFGATVIWTPQFTFILKPLGAYMLMTGLMAGGAARAAMPHPMIAYALTSLFLINAAYRILHFEYVQATFGIATVHLAIQIAALLALGAGCFFLQRAAERSVAPTTG